MNCPSRNDDVLFNPGWNQSPPYFAADLTTCQDLNGIANSRELREADHLRSDSQSLGRRELEDNSFQEKEKERLATGEGAKGSYQGSCTRTFAHMSNEQQGGLNTTNHSFKSWATWLFSVFCTSVFLSFVRGNGIPNIAASAKSAFRTENSVSSTRRLFRRDSCATGDAQPNYNLPFHVGGLFIILFVSTTGCAFPILVTKFPRLRIPPFFLFCAKHFGTGVLIATAFVHLLPTAFLSLSNPCLSGFWTNDYPAMPGAIILASIFFVTIIEMVFSPAQHICGGNAGVAGITRGTEESYVAQPDLGDTQNNMRRTYSDSSVRVREMGPLGGRMTSISRTLTRYREETQRLDAIESAGSVAAVEDSNSGSKECAIEDPERNEQKTQLTPEQVHKKAVMQCFLLEMGILFHSIFIGMSLSVTVGNDFVILLIAIIFHQTFEGLALGVRIAAIDWPARSFQPWFMAIAYGCTTPLGQAIGIATHTLYSPDSEIGLLVVGIMNAVSAGFLIFASLVELMSEDFLSDESWQILRGKNRVIACLLVFLGACLMSLVGAWA